MTALRKKRKLRNSYKDRGFNNTFPCAAQRWRTTRGAFQVSPDCEQCLITTNLNLAISLRDIHPSLAAALGCTSSFFSGKFETAPGRTQTWLDRLHIWATRSYTLWYCSNMLLIHRFVRINFAHEVDHFIHFCHGYVHRKFSRGARKISLWGTTTGESCKIYSGGCCTLAKQSPVWYVELYPLHLGCELVDFSQSRTGKWNSKDCGAHWQLLRAVPCLYLTPVQRKGDVACWCCSEGLLLWMGIWKTYKEKEIPWRSQRIRDFKHAALFWLLPNIVRTCKRFDAHSSTERQYTALFFASRRFLSNSKPLYMAAGCGLSLVLTFASLITFPQRNQWRISQIVWHSGSVMQAAL